MAWKLDKPCPYPGCGIKIHANQRYCAEHKKEVSNRYEAGRPSSSKRGYGKRWHKTAKAHKESNPLCVECGKPVEEIDHIVPHKGNQRLFWDPKNRQSLCKSCHSRKTATEDGRWEPKSHAG